MKMKLIACGTSALLAMALGLQAQTTSAGSTAGQTPSSSTGGAASTGQSTMGSTSQSSTGAAASPSSSSSTNISNQAPGASAGSTATTTPPPSSSGSASGSMSAAGGANGSLNTSTDLNTQATTPTTNTAGTTSNIAAGQINQNSTATTAQQSNTTQQSTTSGGFNTFAGGIASDAAVTTFVQQLDAQGPAVVQQITTAVGPLACSPETIQNLVDALHSGKSVTITSDANGQRQSATFNASGAHLGYGEAYIALGLAAQELRNAGITTCATPEQWQAVLLGGPISATGTTTSVATTGTTQFPGVVKLRTEGQGWGQIAQTTNVQLGQVINTSNVSSNSATTQDNLSPTGYSSAEMNHGRVDTNKDEAKPEKKHHWWSRDKAKDKDQNKDQNPSSTESANPDAGVTAPSNGAPSSTPTTR